MVHGVQIVVQEQQSQERRPLDHGHAAVGQGVGPVLGVRSDQRQGGARIDEGQQVIDQAHAANELQPGHDRQHADGVKRPDPDRVAPAVRGPLAPDKAGDLDDRTEEHAAEERGLEPRADTREGGRRASPRLQIAGFRIAIRRGDFFGGVVGQVRGAVALERQPQRERDRPDQGVQPPRACRVAVDHLVLQRAMPGDQPASDRRPDRPDQRCVPRGGQAPAAIDRDGHEDGRPPRIGEEAFGERGRALESAGRHAVSWRMN